MGIPTLCCQSEFNGAESRCALTGRTFVKANDAFRCSSSALFPELGKRSSNFGVSMIFKCHVGTRPERGSGVASSLQPSTHHSYSVVCHVLRHVNSASPATKGLRTTSWIYCTSLHLQPLCCCPCTGAVWGDPEPPGRYLERILALVSLIPWMWESSFWTSSLARKLSSCKKRETVSSPGDTDRGS